MHKKRHWTILAGLTALVLVGQAALSGCGQTPAAQTNTLKVGLIDAYSGPASVYAKDALDGFQLGVNEVAQNGGPKITFVTRDDQFKTDKDLQWAKELVMQDKVDVVAGLINSAGALAVASYATQQKVPFITWMSMSADITGSHGSPYVFAMPPNTTMIGNAGGVEMAKLPYTKYWLAGDDYDYGRSVVKSFWSSLQKAKPGVQKLGESWWPVGETDYTPYINQIRAAKPDALFVGTGGADMVSFLKAVKAAGLTSQMAVLDHTATDPSTLKALGPDAPVGLYGTSDYLSYYPDTAQNKAFVAAFRKAYNTDPGFPALYGYLTAKFLGAAVQKAGGTDKEKLVAALSGMTMDSPVGPVTIRSGDNQLEAPIFFGKTVVAPGQSSLVAANPVMIPADQIMPSLTDVMAARQSAQK
ncbi:MAG TPA: ABC transporter substrate-binding protein [Spirochaetia bacterium]|nr:ABC transporter substrate-binding protein [Spirochaetia bacterium]